MITNKGRLDTLLNLSSNDDSFTPMGLGFGVITDTKMEGEVLEVLAVSPKHSKVRCNGQMIRGLFWQVPAISRNLPVRALE